jgi:hypothetical protein
MRQRKEAFSPELLRAWEELRMEIARKNHAERTAVDDDDDDDDQGYRRRRKRRRVR